MQRSPHAAIRTWILLFAALPATALAQQASPPPTVGVMTVSPRPIYQEQTYTGRIVSPLIVNLTARVTGYLEEQDFKDGDNVKKGQLLYVIEQPPYQAAVTQAEAGLEQAIAQSRNAGLSFSRAKALLQTPAGAQANVDSAQATALTDNAGIDAARAALQTAQINLGYTEIRAPIDGQIGATTIDPGNVVGPATGTLDTIVAQDPMYVTFSLPVADALKFRQTSSPSNLDLLIQLPDGSTYNQTGQIDFINNQVSADTDSITWRGTIANPPLPSSIPGNNRELTSGEFVTVILRAKTPTQQIAIPRDAVITDQLGDYVLKLTPQNVVTRQPVTMGQQTDTQVEILTGLQPGDKIVTHGIQRIHPGLTVNPQNAPPT